MKTKTWKLFCLFVILSMALAACGTPAPATPPVIAIPEASTSTVTSTTTPPPFLQVGEVEIVVTPTIDIQAVPAPRPEDEAYIIHLEADENLNVALDEVDRSTRDYLLTHSQEEMFHDTVFVTGLLGTLLKFGLLPKFCREYGKDAANHLLETKDNIPEYRFRRLGNSAGLFNFKERLMNGTYQLLGLFASKTLGRAGFMLEIDGKIFWIILSNESRNTVIPATTEEAIKYGRNFLIDEGGYIAKNGGQIFASREIGAMLGLGTYALDAAMIAQTTQILSAFASCLDQKMTEKSSKYREWKERRANGDTTTNAAEDTAAKYVYLDEADLVADIQLLHTLGIVQSNLIVEGENQRQAVKFTMIVGTAAFALYVAPIAIDAALAAEIAKEVGTTGVILYRISFAAP